MGGDLSEPKREFVLGLGDGKYLGIRWWPKSDDIDNESPECLEFYHAEESEYDDDFTDDIVVKKRLQKPKEGERESHLYYSLDDDEWM